MRGRRMFSLVAMMLAVGCGAPGDKVDVLEPNAVEYTFSLNGGDATTVRVAVRARGDSDGTTRFEVAASWAGVDDCERFVHGLTVKEASGRECVLSKHPSTPNGWTAEHEPYAMLTADYELRPSGPDPLADARTRYEPVVRDDLFLLIGEMGLIYPKRLNECGPVDIRLRWTGFQERGWTVLSSFSDEGERLARRPLPAFRNAVFLAGRVRVHDRDVRGGLLRIATYGDDWPFADEELVDLIERVVVAEREFVDDFAFPHFLVTAVPAGPRATPQSLSLAGIRLTGSVALFLAPGTLLRTDPVHREHVLRQLAHECFHTWNGGKIVFAQPEEACYWFSEGFTEFYASRLLRRAGLIDDASWVDGTNRALERLWLSPVATASATTIVSDLWSNYEIQLLTLLRGEITALALEEEIRRVSGGEKTLDDFFREVLAAARDGEVEETGRLLARVARWTSPEFADALRRVIVDGALPSPPASLSEPPADRFYAEAVRDGDQASSIESLPQGRALRLPQYRLRKADADSR